MKKIQQKYNKRISYLKKRKKDSPWGLPMAHTPKDESIQIYSMYMQENRRGRLWC